MFSTDLALYNETKTILLSEIEASKNAIASGQCSDYAAYRYAIGRLTGLGDALAALEGAYTKVTGGK